MQCIIYALIDPRNNLIRYIGKTKHGTKRIDQHYKILKKDQTYKAGWLRQLESAGVKFDSYVLDVAESPAALNELEVWWIAYGRALGWPLTNMTGGGDGLALPTEETLHRMSAARVRQWEEDPSFREMHREKALKQWQDPEFAAMVSRLGKERWEDPEFRAKQSEDARRKGSTRWQDPDYRSKMVEGMRRAGMRRRLHRVLKAKFPACVG
jgi:hypothetical protein